MTQPNEYYIVLWRQNKNSRFGVYSSVMDNLETAKSEVVHCTLLTPHVEFKIAKLDIMDLPTSPLNEQRIFTL